MTDILITGHPIVNIGRLMFMRSNRERSGFGQRMYEARKRAGLTQKEVQAKLGISQSNMSDLEGMAESSSFTAQLAALYGCSPSWLATGEGWVDGYSIDPNAYALRVKGDSMHPAIRHGAFVIVEPNGLCMPGEYVAIALTDGRKMVKELIMERPDEIVVESVNGNQRQTLDRSMIEHIHPVAAVVAASKWRPA